jgi:outer membrane protein TolC
MKNKTIIQILPGILFLLFSAGIQAQSLNDYLKQAAENHPGIQAAYHEYYAALEKVPQVGTLPDPKLSFGYFISPIETRLGPQQLKISVSQMFPWFGTLDEKEKMAAEQARVQYQQFIEKRNTVYKQVKIQWYRLYKTTEAIRITRENLEILNSLKKLSRSNYENDKGQMTDLLRIDVNIREQENRLADLQEQLSSQKVDFNLLLNRPADDSLVAPGNIQADTFNTVAYRDSVRNHPDMTALENKQAALEHQYQVDKKMGYPSISLALDYAVIGERQDMQVNNSGRDVIMPMVGISIPLYRKKYEAMKKETELKIKSVQSKQQEKINTLSSQYKQEEEQYVDALRQIDLYKEQVKETERIYNLLKTSYSADGENFFELLRTRLMVLEYQLKLEQARANRNIAVAKLEYLTNQNL